MPSSLSPPQLRPKSPVLPRQLAASQWPKSPVSQHSLLPLSRLIPQSMKVRLGALARRLLLLLLPLAGSLLLGASFAAASCCCLLLGAPCSQSSVAYACTSLQIVLRPLPQP